ncbi:hypothetical protein MDG893_19224, partial [Marinobacter algicola DG893]
WEVHTHWSGRGRATGEGANQAIVGITIGAVSEA